MRKQILFVGLLCLCMISNGQTEQIAIPRIEKMPHIPQPYLYVIGKPLRSSM